MKTLCKKLKEVFCNWRILVRNYGVTFGFLATIVTVVSPFVPSECQWESSLLLVLLVACLIVSVMMTWPVNEVKMMLKVSIPVTIKEGNIFEVKKGVVVIPFNNFFDTLVDNKVVGTDTLHGKFVNWFKENYKSIDLEKEISSSLTLYTTTYAAARTVPEKQLRYPLGAVARVSVSNELHFYLVAATEFDEFNHPIDQPEKYSYVLQRLYDYINTNCSGLPVYLPLIGTGQMGLGLDDEETLMEMIHNLKLMRHYVVNAGTHIIVHPNNMQNISLRKVDYLIKES